MLELNGQREVGGGDRRARQALKGVRSSKKRDKDVADAHGAYSFTLQLKKRMWTQQMSESSSGRE